MQYSCVTVPPAVRRTLLRQMDMGSFTCAQIWVRAIRTKGGQAQTIKSPQELTRGNINTFTYPAPSRGSNPGSAGLNSDALTTELHPRCWVTGSIESHKWNGTYCNHRSNYDLTVYDTYHCFWSDIFLGEKMNLNTLGRPRVVFTEHFIRG